MESLISLVNKIQRACTALGDHGNTSALPTLWESLPAIAVIGGQAIGHSSLTMCGIFSSVYLVCFGRCYVIASISWLARNPACTSYVFAEALRM
ncbi:hypothetical protein NL676_008502 [Syzygium grande]|nr:hypothetical protein NL676_008502 [Syzygium grande]